jgi:hypothetical protein
MLSGPSQATSLFASGRTKAILHERLGGEIEFAHDDRIAAAARQADERARVIAETDLYIFPDPILLFLDGERIEIENGFPSGRRFAIFGERGASP